MTIDVGREVHRVALELRPAVLDDMGLPAALSTYVEDWSRRYHIPADFHTVGLDGTRVAPEIETTIYRVVQEALTNVARHAGASAVNVVLQRRFNELVAIVEDDGRGFDAAAAFTSIADDGPLGLLGMRERVALVGGRFTVESQTGGTTVHLRIPVESLAAGSHV
jgi:signal transduction histidine kinase